MSSSSTSVLVKSKSQIYAMPPAAGQGHTLYAKVSVHVQQFLTLGAYVLGLVVVVLVCIDSIFNNWAINDFIGNGYQYMTAVAAVSNLDQLSNSYVFPKGGTLHDLSNIGLWMMNYTVYNLVTPDNPRVYVLDAGTFVMNEKFATYCSVFNKRTFAPVDIANGGPQLGVAQDTITFLRGNAFTHVTTDDATANLANSSMNHRQLADLGYASTRIQADLRLTEPVPVKNVSTPQVFNVSYYRYYPKSFCTGCRPIGSFVHSSCALTMVYNASAKSVRITGTAPVIGALWVNGLMIQQSAFSAASHYLKGIALLFALGGFLASRRTVQWQDVDVHATETFVHRALKTVLPEYYPHVSHALRFDMFCYNSDIFVLLFTTGVLLDIGHGITFIREVNLFHNLSPDPWMSIQLFALSTRLLWLNCAFLKALKVLVNLVSTASYCGESKLMGFCNFTSVTSLYLSAVLLFYVPAFIEYNNSVRQDLTSAVEKLDGVTVNFYDSFYIRGSGAIAGGLILNVVLVVVVDQLANRSFWKHLATNSLGRQAMFNSTSILMDYITDIDPPMLQRSMAIIHCKARRLCTLQWFFMSHLTTFGLPEKELRAKKQQNKAHQTNRTTTNNTSSHAPGQTHAVESTRLQSADGKPAGEDRYLVVQDQGHHIHLLDAELCDVKNLMLNIKVLKNTDVAIH